MSFEIFLKKWKLKQKKIIFVMLNSFFLKAPWGSPSISIFPFDFNFFFICVDALCKNLKSKGERKTEIERELHGTTTKPDYKKKFF